VPVGKGISTSRGQVWEWLHSTWILLTFTFGFINWVAFAYIGLRARQPKWLLAAVLYAGECPPRIHGRTPPGEGDIHQNDALAKRKDSR
jgi:hypothetical protein